MPPKILVAEDEPALRDLSAARLTREGYEVITAADGERALTLAAEEKPDIVLLDIKMPKIDGIEVCRILKSGPATQSIKIVAFSAKAELVDKRRGLAAGIDLYLTKPLPFEELLDGIEEILKE